MKTIRLITAQKRNKYGAIKQKVDDYTFDSKKEAKRYSELKFLAMSGQIKDLKIQPKFPCHVNNKETNESIFIGNYILDFSYFDVLKGHSIYEDVKGISSKTGVAVTTDLFKWKKKHVEAEYGIKILLV